MRSKLLIASFLLLPAISLCQPPKRNPNKPPTPLPAVAKGEAVADTLITKMDTTRHCFAIWAGGDEFTIEGYLTRLNGFVVRINKYGKFIAQEPQYKYYDWQWKEIKAEKIEPSLSKQVNWKQ